jgi:hypothetical protein
MKYIGLCAILLLMLTGCHRNGTWMDAQIDPALRDKMNELNGQVLKDISGRNVNDLRNISSDSLWSSNGTNIEDQILHTQTLPDPNTFKVKNQFYLKFYGADANRNSTMHRTKGSEHDYLLTFQPINKETLVTLGYFNQSPESFALTTSYGKYGDNWKLNIMQIGLLKVMNRDAIDWYHSAQKDFDSGYLVDAGNDLLLCEQLLKPAGGLLHYEKEKEINDLDQKLTSAITQRYPFPLTDSLVATKPSIFKISLYRTSDGYYPFILYKTKYALTDSVALSRECDAVCAHLGDLFYGLDKGKKYLFFRAYSKLDPSKMDEGYKDFRRNGKFPATSVE